MKQNNKNESKGLKQKLNIFNFWQGNNKDRILLFGIIIGVYALIKVLEEFVPNHFLEKLPSDVSLTLVASLIVIMGVHAFYIFVAQYHRRRNPHALNDDYQPHIDIFISAHNEENVIGATIKYLLDLSYENLKIYIINDRSSDKTQEIVDDLVSANPGGGIIAIHRPQDAFPGKSAALNDALKVSNGEVICILDADARIDDDFLSSIVRHLDDPKVGAVQAQKVISNPEFNALTRFQFHEYAMDTYLQMGRDSIHGAVELRGNGMLVKREALYDVGGWNEETLTDDLDLSTCLHVNGWDIRYSPENKVYEEGVPTINGFVKQRRRWAEGSMRRYLNYFLQVFKPGNLSPVQIFDTFVFLCEFSIPLWLSLDIVYEFIRLYSGRETYFSFLMLTSTGLSMILFMHLFNGLRIYKRQGFFEAIWNATTTLVYLLFSWTTVIMVTYRKILFSRTVGTWTRTEHGK